MIRTSVAALSCLALVACGGNEGVEPAETPDVETGEIDLTVGEIAGPSTWEIDREASSIRFGATQNNRAFEGGFGRWEAGILMNPEAPGEEGEIEAIIDLSSVDAGSKDRNEALPGEGWFNTALHPTAIFKSNDISETGDGTYVADGTLTIKGITREVAMPFTLDIDEAGRAVADGTVVLNRADFGVGAGEFSEGKWVGLNVQVMLHMEAVPSE